MKINGVDVGDVEEISVEKKYFCPANFETFFRENNVNPDIVNVLLVYEQYGEMCIVYETKKGGKK